RNLISNGLCLAAVLSFAGCASERTSRPAFSWGRNLNPFRALANRDTDDMSESLSPAAAPQSQWTPSDPADSYYSPGSVEFSQPQRATQPAAPAASEPGYFADDSETATQSTSGRTQYDARPGRLKDVFENWGRRQSSEPRPTIPLDEPVAQVTEESR